MSLTKEHGFQNGLSVPISDTPLPEKPKVVSIPVNTSNGSEAAEPNETERDDHKGNWSQPPGQSVWTSLFEQIHQKFEEE